MDFQLNQGCRIIQGSADHVRKFYKQVSTDKNLVIINVARRYGSDEVQLSSGGGKIYWLPMLESNSEEKSLAYIEKYKDDFSQFAKDSSKIVVVNCQEGMHRSPAFVKHFVTAFETKQEVEAIESKQDS
jgi:hypothetical protein